MSGGASTWNGSIDFSNTDLFLDHAGITLTLGANLSSRNLYFYRGNLNLAGRTVTTTDNFVVFGGSYSEDDPDFTTVPDSRFAYYIAAPLAYYSGGGTYIAGDFSVNTSAAFVNLAGTAISVGGNFYLNGADMDAGAWGLTILSNAASSPVYNATSAVTSTQWGTPYAVAFWSAISGSTVAGGVVAAPEPGAAPDGGAHHNTTDSGGNSGWNFTAPRIISVETVYDDVLRLTFDQAIENSNNEINAVISSILTDTGASAFTGAFNDPACVPANSTDGDGDLITFYIQTTNTSWNTDATGIGIGAALSTDRDGNHQTTITDLTIPLGLLRAASGQGFVRNYGTTAVATTQVYDGQAGVGSFADECRPVLVEASVGHSDPSQLDVRDPWDGHNYIQLRYSEPVDFGNAAGFTILDATASNEQSMALFTGIAERGGSMSGSTLTGYASFAVGNVSLGRRTDNALAADDDALLATQVNGMYRAAPNAYGSHGLYVSMAGWSYPFGLDQYWPGYFTSSPVQPSGNVTVNSNAFIIDASGNAVEPTADPYAKAAITVTQVAVGWDVTPPEVSDTLIPGYYDIIPLASGSEIDRFELRFTEPMRDSSFYYRDSTTSGIAGFLGWLFRDVDNGPNASTGPSDFDTQVTSSAFSTIDVPDDTLSSMISALVSFNPLWTARSQMLFTYSRATGLVTDTAGNLLIDYTDGQCAEKQPPKIRFTSAEIGGSRIYLQFTEPVWHDEGATTSRNFLDSDFILTGSSSSITAVSVFGTSGPVSEAWLQLSGAITTADAMDARIALNNTVLDRADNMAEVAVVRHAVNLAVGVVDVPAASDGIHIGDATTTTDALATGALGLLRVFDGTGRLYDMDTTIFTTLDLSGIAGTAPPLTMYYDVAPDDSVFQTIDITGRTASLGEFWLPAYLSGFNLSGNTAARSLTPYSINDPSRNLLVPSSDPEIVTGSEVGFMFRLGDLWVGRDTSADDDPRQFDLWRYKVQDIIKQRGGVTIMNNVINSLKRERTAIQVDLATGGQVSVLVFTLDGDVVRSLSRGRLAAGSYTLTWDGTNAGGNPVARGMYFIRVVGPNLDEIRKVMVVKE